MTRLLLSLTAALGLLAATAGAEQYWITYEGNDLPENEGWNRDYGNWEGPHHGEAIRTVEDGILTMDSLFDDGVYDYAYLFRPGCLDPEAGELFVIEWRLKVEEVTGDYYDPSVGVGSDEGWQIGFGFYMDRIRSIFEDDVYIPFEPGIFHEYRCTSVDMRSYELYIDGDLARVGTFWQGILDSFVGWGDAVSGAASRTHWDYVRYGVIPEPTTLTVLIVFCLGSIRRLPRACKAL